MEVFIIFFGFAGFILAAYITHKKRRRSEHFVCPLRGRCTEVIHSSYATFLGVPVEYLGLAYYTFIALGYGARVAFPDATLWLSPVLLFASTFAVVFSFYLTFIQIATLKKLCTWCLLSALFCVSIFTLALYGHLDVLSVILTSFKSWIVLLHVLFVAVGLGAATFSDVFFFRFLKDFHISEDEASILDLFSQVIWLVLGLIIVTGLGLFLSDPSVYIVSTKFQIKMTVFAVIVFNGAFLNLLVAPKLLNITFGREHAHQSGELRRARRWAFVLGPISIVSWYVAFILGALPLIPFSYADALVYYVFLLALAVYLAYVVECAIDRKASI